MSRNDVDLPSLHGAVEGMPETFHTKDVSWLPPIRQANASLVGLRNYHAFVGGALSDNRGYLGIELLSTGHSRGALWRRLSGGAQPVPATSSFVAPASAPAWQGGTIAGDAPLDSLTSGLVVRPGHFETVRYMCGESFRGVKDLFEAVPEFGGVYFRPLENGVRVVDLDETSPKPRIGVGYDSLIPRGSRVEHLAPSIPTRIDYLKQVRARQTAPSLENQFEARMIRAALRNGLRLPGFGDDVRFIHSQWRIDRPNGVSGQAFTDLIAADLRTKTLVIIELKAFPDGVAAMQATQYARYFQRRGEQLFPLFTQIARMMGELYDCPELSEFAFDTSSVDAYTAWPTIAGDVVVTHVSIPPLRNVDVPSPKPAGFDLTAERAEQEIGPQNGGTEPSFRRRMRFHQSWYRASVLRVPCGTGPGAGSDTRYGNMLPADAAEAGANFLTPEIFGVVRERISAATGAVDSFRLLRNMLSSQPLCFNLFAPLKRNLDLATKLMQATFGAERVQRVTDVKIEYAPQPAFEYLGDRTAFDVFIEYVAPDDEPGFFGIEVKLTETFSAKRYDGARYRTLVARPGSPWRSEAGELLADERWNQLWRNHMLVDALRTHRTPIHGRTGSLVVLRHPLDTECTTACATYRTMLAQPSDLIELTLDDMISRWGSVELDADRRVWLRELRRRYLDLNESEEAWRDYPRGS